MTTDAYDKVINKDHHKGTIIINVQTMYHITSISGERNIKLGCDGQEQHFLLLKIKKPPVPFSGR